VFGLVKLGDQVAVGDDGQRYEVTVFGLVDKQGNALVKLTPNGPVQMMIMSQPVAMGPAVLVAR
jgi:hypothetical protein